MTIHPIYGSNGIIDTFKLKYFFKNICSYW